jgi:hypothetical protein
MESNALELLGVDPAILLLFMFILIVVLGIACLSLNTKIKRMKVHYATFMRGKDGRSLEKAMLERFSDIEKLIRSTRQNRADINEIRRKMDEDYQKVGIVKYDAFNEMGGKLSFALAMLDGNNNGWIINAMHSREGCYTYIKEIVKGQSYVELSEEETQALDKAVFKEVYELSDQLQQSKAGKKGNTKSADQRSSYEEAEDEEPVVYKEKYQTLAKSDTAKIEIDEDALRAIERGKRMAAAQKRLKPGQSPILSSKNEIDEDEEAGDYDNGFNEYNEADYDADEYEEDGVVLVDID